MAPPPAQSRTTRKGKWPESATVAVFTPGKGETSPVPDGDYLHYGFWVKSSEDKMGDPVYEIQTFVDGSMAYGTLTDLTGKATYVGKAGGVYSQKIAYDSTTGELVSRPRRRLHGGRQ